MNPKILSQLGEQSAAIGRLIDAMTAILEDLKDCDALCPELKHAMLELKWAESKATIILHDAARRCSSCEGKRNRLLECI